jgi:hypothetical protein
MPQPRGWDNVAWSEFRVSVWKASTEVFDFLTYYFVLIL